MKEENIYYKRFPELLQDEKFLRWRFSPDEETNKHWADLLKAYPTLQKEINLADDYLLNKNFKKNKLNPTDREELLNRILTSVQNPAYSKKRKIIPLWIRYAAACVLAVTMGIFIYLNKSQPTVKTEMIVGNLLKSESVQLVTSSNTTSFDENIDVKIGADGVARVQGKNQPEENIKIDDHTMNKLIVPYGKQSGIELPDGTKIKLNSGSVLEFPSVFAENERSVRVSGEMYIEVAKDKRKPFYVHTSDFKVQVFGTKFNISSYKNSPKSVVLVEGSVGLKSVSGKEIKLSPNELAVCTAGNFHKQKVDVSRYVSWKDGYIFCDETPIADLMKYVERYYNVSFNFEKSVNLMNYTCKGKLYLSDDIDNVMNSIALLSATTYRRENNIIYISK